MRIFTIIASLILIAACGGDPLDGQQDSTIQAAVLQRCNDGNRISGDGCSADGYVEDGYTCTTIRRRSVCHLLP